MQGIQPETKPRKPLPDCVRKIISNATLEDGKNGPVLIINKRTKGSRPTTMATQARFLSGWLNNRYNGRNSRKNKVLEYPDFNNTEEHHATISISQEAYPFIKEFLRKNRS